MADKQQSSAGPSIQDVFSIVSDSDSEAKRTKFNGRYIVEFFYQEGQYQGVNDTRARTGVRRRG